MFVMEKHVFCTPKKTGTHSIHSMFRKHGEVVSPWHSTEWPNDGRIRLMVIRHPLDRLASMFHFAQRVNSAWLKRYADYGFAAWWPKFRDAPLNDWTKTCADYEDEFQPDIVFKLENGLDEVARYLEIEVKERFNNATHRRPSWEETIPDGLVDQCSLWAHRDIERFSYEW